MNELISIIVPIYNVEKYLEKCIKSIIEQTYKNIEIILVDDGSPDNCAKICDEYNKKYDRIIVIHKQNGGLSDARNAGINISKGSYLAFVDSDDYILPEFIENLYNICKNNNVMISQCSYIETKEDNAKSEPIISGIIEKNYKEMIEGIYHYEENIVVWNKLYKKELFEKIRFPKGKIHEDEFTVYKLYYLAKRAVVSYDKLYCYRIAPGSITRSGFNIKRLAAIEAYEERMTFLKEKDEYELLLKTMREYYYMLLEINSKISKKTKEYSKEIDSIKKKIKKTKNIIIRTKEFNFKFKLFVFLTSNTPRFSVCLFNFINSIKKINNRYCKNIL